MFFLLKKRGKKLKEKVLTNVFNFTSFQSSWPCSCLRISYSPLKFGQGEACRVVCAVDSSPWEGFQNSDCQWGLCQVFQLTGFISRSKWIGEPPPPPLRNDVIVYQRKGEMRQREGSQKTNLGQKYLFSFIRFQRWQIWRYCKNVTASWISNVHPFKLDHERGVKTWQLRFLYFQSLTTCTVSVRASKSSSLSKQNYFFLFFQGRCIGGI